MNELYDDISELLRQVIGRNKIKYRVLDGLITLPRINAIHINLDSIFSFITAKYLNTTEEIDERYKYVIASSVLNIIGHYRHYCVKRGWVPTFYMYASNKWSDLVKASLSVVEIISNYLDKIYFLKVSKSDSPNMYMKYFIDSQKNSENLILTKDIMDLQLISKHTHIIHLNKDTSVYYTPDNLYSEFTEGKIENSNISYKLIGPILFYSGTGTKNSGVKGSGRKKTVKLFAKLIDGKYILNDRYHSCEDLISDMSSEICEDFSNFRENFEKYDLYTKYPKFLTKTKEQVLNSYIVDKFSKKDLYDLNNKYFTGLDSLLLEYLLEIPANSSAVGININLRW